MTENKIIEIQNYVSEEIKNLNEELKDLNNYKRNPYPDQTSVITFLKEGAI